MDMRWLSMVVLRFNKDAPIVAVTVKLQGKDLLLEPRMVLDTGATHV